MLSTINGFDLLLVLIISALIFIISLQRRVIKDLSLDLRIERIHSDILEYTCNDLAWTLQTERQADLYEMHDQP